MKVFVLSIFILAACGPSQKEPKLADEVLKWKEELEKKSEEKTQSLMGAEQNTSVKKNGYKGQVKSVIVSKFVLTENFGELVKERVSSSSHKYDKKGYTVERVICDANGDIIRKDTFKYDAKGNTPEGVVYSRLSHDADGKIAEKATYKNDAKGNTLEIRIY